MWVLSPLARVEEYEVEIEVSEREEGGMMQEARGVDLYRSMIKALPKEMTGVVAYTGMRLNRGICLQQCAKAAR